MTRETTGETLARMERGEGNADDYSRVADAINNIVKFEPDREPEAEQWRERLASLRG